mgnify:FL=1
MPARRHIPKRLPLPRLRSKASTTPRQPSLPLTEEPEETKSHASTGIAFRANGPLLEWAAVQELEVLEAKVLEEQQHQKLKQQRQEHMSMLNAQREQTLQAEGERRDMLRRWRLEAEEDAQRFHQEEAAKKQRTFETRRQFDEERREQMAAAKRQQEERQKAEFEEGQRQLRVAFAEREKVRGWRRSESGGEKGAREADEGTCTGLEDDRRGQSGCRGKTTTTGRRVQT